MWAAHSGRGWAALCSWSRRARARFPLYSQPDSSSRHGCPRLRGWSRCWAGLLLISEGRGGKGVATSLGAGLALAPLPALVCVAVWVALFATFRISSIGSWQRWPASPPFSGCSTRQPDNLTFAAAVALLVFLAPQGQHSPSCARRKIASLASQFNASAAPSQARVAQQLLVAYSTSFGLSLVLV